MYAQHYLAENYTREVINIVPSFGENETHMTLLENDPRSHIFKCKMIQDCKYL